MGDGVVTPAGVDGHVADVGVGRLLLEVILGLVVVERVVRVVDKTGADVGIGVNLNVEDGAGGWFGGAPDHSTQYSLPISSAAQFTPGL